MKKNALTARDSHLWSLRAVTLMSTLVAVYAIYGLSVATNEITVRIPPDYSKGVLLNPNTFPKSALYAGTYMIFQNLQFWKNDGQDDYKRNLDAYSCYTNAPMKKWLEDDYAEKNRARELFRRTRNISLAGVYNDNLVQEVGNGVWRVWLDIQIKDYLSNELFKQTTVRYPFQIAVDNRSCNPLGIAIDSMFSNPVRIQAAGSEE